MLAEGTAGGSVPYVRIPNVGVRVGPPETGCVAVAVNADTTVPGVAVAGVVVRFGIGVEVGASEVDSAVAVGEEATTGVDVSVGGTVVGEG